MPLHCMYYTKFILHAWWCWLFFIAATCNHAQDWLLWKHQYSNTCMMKHFQLQVIPHHTHHWLPYRSWWQWEASLISGAIVSVSQLGSSVVHPDASPSTAEGKEVFSGGRGWYHYSWSDVPGRDDVNVHVCVCVCMHEHPCISFA